jgi:hypothetical protein
MELFDALPGSLNLDAPLPPRWSESPPLAGCRTVGEVVDAVGRVSGRSDAVIAALLAMPLDDELVVPVLVAGLRRLLFLCRGSRRELLDDLVVELAIAIGELRRVRPLVFRRRLAYVIVDRARDRQRAALRRERTWRPVDALGVAELLESGDAGVEEAAVDRVRLGVVRDQIVAAGDVALARSWNSLVELMDSPRESQAERDRWKYVRRRLAGHLGPDAA